MKIAANVLALFLAAAGLVGPASAAHSPNYDYYKGKTLRFIVAFSACGTFDAYTRALAKPGAKWVMTHPTAMW